mmetsp:Transcript_34764/g.69048  ORF Transcript_34764/g.69048 Transcript_34764/m.69048 type:complete len:102 (+) Transcript_34764:504-809(+)
MIRVRFEKTEQTKGRINDRKTFWFCLGGRDGFHDGSVALCGWSKFREREREKKKKNARANHQTNKNKEITQGNKPVTWPKLNANREIKPVLVLMGDAKEFA